MNRGVRGDRISWRASSFFKSNIDLSNRADWIQVCFSEDRPFLLRVVLLRSYIYSFFFFLTNLIERIFKQGNFLMQINQDNRKERSTYVKWRI